MKKNLMWIIGTVVVALLFVGVFFLYENLSKDYQMEDLGGSEQTVQQVPDFTVQDATGEDVKLSDYFGKPIVLNFWASWCPPCREEMPHFEEAYKNNPGIQFLMVNMTTGDNMEDAKALIEQEEYSFPVFYNTYGEAERLYNVSSLPTTYFINKDGTLEKYAVGMLTKDALESRLELIR